MVEDCVISCYNHLARGDYGESTNFQNGRLAIFVDVSEEEVNRMKENRIPKGTKDAAKSGVRLLFRRQDMKILLIRIKKTL